MKVKFKKIFLFLILFIVMIVGVNAIGTAPNSVNTTAYYKFENNTNDATNNNNDGINNGAIPTTGKIGLGYSFDGLTQYISAPPIASDNPFTINAWIDPNIVLNNNMLVTQGESGLGFLLDGKQTVDLGYRFYDGSGWHFDDTVDQGFTAAGGWQMITVTYDGNALSIYRNAELVDQDSGVTVNVGSGNLNIGRRADSGLGEYDGLMDEVAFFNYSLGIQEIIYLNASGNPTIAQQYPFVGEPSINFVNILVNNETFINNSFFNLDDLNWTVEIENISTNANINMSYKLYNESFSLIKESSFSNNSLTGTFKLFNLTEQKYFIDILAFNNEVNTSTGNLTFTIDLTPPSVNLTLPNEYNSYFNFNISQYIEFSNNGSTCLVNVLYNLSLENTINCNNTNYNFSFNGDYTFNATITDLANNSANDVSIMLVNPYQYFNFQLANGTAVTNYTFGGTQFDTVANFTVYNDILNLGNNTLTFEKLGYVSENFTFNINLTSDLNITFNVSQAQIIVNIFDRQTGSKLLQLVDIVILGLGNKSTSNGTAIFKDFNFVAGDYHIEASSSGFYTSEQDFTYTSESNAIINMYLLNSTFEGSTTLVVPVIDEFFNVIQGADTRLLEYDSSIFGFKEVSSCLTNSNGECKFLIEVTTKTYIITTSKEIGGVIFTDQSSINGEIFLPDISAGEEIPGQIFLNNLVLKLSSTLSTPGTIGLIIDSPKDVNETIISQNGTSTVINLPVSFTSQSGLAYTVCLEVYRVTGDSFSNAISPVCLTAASGILPTSNIILNNDFDYEVRVTYEFDDVTVIYQTYKYPNTKSFVQIILNSGFASPAIMFLWIILLSVALYLRNIALWCWGAWTLSVVQLGIFTNLLVASSSVIIIVINIGVFYISKKQGDST